MRRPELLVLLLVACGGDCPRPEVKGDAEPEVLGAARRAVDAFFDRLPDGDPVCVSAVKIGRTSRQHGGWYRRVDRRIKVSDEAPDWGVELAVFHELCHAVDYQRELRTVDDRDLWSLRDDYTWFDADRNGSRRAAREAFAYTCMVGPRGYDLLASLSCPTDEGTEEILAWLSDVYGPPQRWPEVVLEPVASVAAEKTFRIQVWDNGVVQIDDTWFDLASGEPVEPSPAGSLVEPVPFEPERPWGAYGVTNTLNHATQWSSATGARLVRVQTVDGLGCYPTEEPVRWATDPDGRLLVFTWSDGGLTWSRYELVESETISGAG